MKIIIETIPHGRQRYPTAGDWYLADGELKIRVSKLGNWRYEMAVAVHEIVEALLCMNNGVSEADVDVFDVTYRGEGEPGDDAAAPYSNEHCFATAVERMLIAAFGVSWAEYEAAVEKLP